MERFGMYLEDRDQSLTLSLIPLACFLSIDKVNLREASCSEITEYGSGLIVSEALRVETWRWPEAGFEPWL